MRMNKSNMSADVYSGLDELVRKNNEDEYINEFGERYNIVT